MTFNIMDDDGDDEFGLSNAEEYFDKAAQYSFTGIPSSRLLQLPPEILTLIVENVLTPNSRASYLPQPSHLAILKDLRTVHPHIARLRIVQNKLFRTIYLRPDPDQLRDLERNAKGFSNIAPFVRQVLFEPVLIHRRDLPPNRAHDLTATVQELLGVRVRRAVKEGRVLAIWTKILQQLTNVSGFSLVHTQRTTWETINCGPGPLNLLNLTLDCLSKITHGSIHELRLEYFHAEDEFVWTKVPQWGDISVDQLESLKFAFEINHLSGRKWDYRKTFGLESVAVLTNLLHASASKLRDLTLQGQVISTLFSPATKTLPSLPKVHLLHLDNATIDASCFSAWLPALPSLRVLKLRSIGVGNESNLEDWRPIFDAIRDQSYNGLELEMENLRLLAALRFRTAVSLRHLVPSKPVPEPSLDRVWSEISMMLKSYLSKTGEWFVRGHWDPANYQESDQEEEDDPSAFEEEDSEGMEEEGNSDDELEAETWRDMTPLAPQDEYDLEGGWPAQRARHQDSEEEVDDEAEDEEIATQLQAGYERKEPDYENDYDDFINAFYAEKSRRVEARRAARR